MASNNFGHVLRKSANQLDGFKEWDSYHLSAVQSAGFSLPGYSHQMSTHQLVDARLAAMAGTSLHLAAESQWTPRSPRRIRGRHAVVVLGPHTVFQQTVNSSCVELRSHDSGL